MHDAPHAATNLAHVGWVGFDPFDLVFAWLQLDYLIRFGWVGFGWFRLGFVKRTLTMPWPWCRHYNAYRLLRSFEHTVRSRGLTSSALLPTVDPSTTTPSSAAVVPVVIPTELVPLVDTLQRLAHARVVPLGAQLHVGTTLLAELGTGTVHYAYLCCVWGRLRGTCAGLSRFMCRVPFVLHCPPVILLRISVVLCVPSPPAPHAPHKTSNMSQHLTTTKPHTTSHCVQCQHLQE